MASFVYEKMENEVKERNVIAVVCSDIHLSHRPPIARSAEPDWYAAMKRSLDELRELAVEHDVPIICAGDIFDDGWRPHRVPPELINFAIGALPKMYAIPGQHDLPMHRYEDIRRSAYWTLVEAGVVKDLNPDSALGYAFHKIETHHPLWVMPFPWGYPIKPAHESKDDAVQLAVVHEYMWVNKKGYPGAPESQRVSKKLDQLKGYDAVLVGDNHKGFLCNQVFNCGSFFRRKSDEFSYTPQVGLLHKDGSFSRHYLDITEDKFIDIEEALGLVEQVLDMSDFVEELAKLGEKGVNFIEAVKRFITNNNIGERTKQTILDILEKKS